MFVTAHLSFRQRDRFEVCMPSAILIRTRNDQSSIRDTNSEIVMRRTHQLPDLFSQSLSNYYEQARLNVRNFVAALQCETIETMGTVGFVASRTTDQLCLKVPSIDEEPIDRKLEGDGATAMYAHHVTNESSLTFKPSTLAFGGWNYRGTFDRGRFEIRFSAEGNNPSPKERHAQIVGQIKANVATLAREIENNNLALLAMIEPELQKRKARCTDLARRRAEL